MNDFAAPPSGDQDDRTCLDDASYVLGSLTLPDRHAYERHLGTCSGCQTSVQRLAGLPGLLALLGPEGLSEAGSAQDQPAGPGPELAQGSMQSSLLPDLLARVAAGRRRRRWATVAAGLAAVSALVLVLVLNRPAPSGALGGYPGSGSAAQPTTGSAQASTGATAASGTSPVAVPTQKVVLRQLVPGPMGATVALDYRKWGTSITLECSYNGTVSTAGYDLVVVDRAGRSSTAGSWRAVGPRATVVAATELHPAEIADVRITLDDGTVILSGTP